MEQQFLIQTEDSQLCYRKKCGDWDQTGATANWPREFWKFPCNNTLVIGLEVYSVPVLGENPHAFKKHEKDRKNNSSDPVMGHNLKLKNTVP